MGLVQRTDGAQTPWVVPSIDWHASPEDLTLTIRQAKDKEAKKIRLILVLNKRSYWLKELNEFAHLVSPFIL